MNYAAHYQRLINRARARTLSGYFERHHIIPRCMEGSNEPTNIVPLTPEEHFVAHELLIKIYPKCRRLVHALALLSGARRGNKLYGWHKRLLSEAMLGNKRTLGRKMPPRSPEWRAKRSEAMRGRKLSPETRAKLSALLRLRKRPPDIMKNALAAIRGKPRSPEHSAKLAAALRGKKLPPRSAEHREKIAANKRGKPRPFRTPEWRANHAAAVRASWERKRRTATCEL